MNKLLFIIVCLMSVSAMQGQHTAILSMYNVAGGGGSPTTEFLDTFTEASQTELASHDPDTGDASSWTRSDATVFYVEHSSGPTGAVCLADNTSSNKHALNTTTVSNDITITALMGFYATPGGSTNYKIGIWARASQSSWTMTGYHFRVDGDGSVTVSEVTSGSGTDIITGSISGFDWSHEYRLICTLNGTTIGLVIQDVDDSDTQVFSDSTTDSDHSSGSVGLLMRASSLNYAPYCNSLQVQDIP